MEDRERRKKKLEKLRLKVQIKVRKKKINHLQKELSELMTEFQRISYELRKDVEDRKLKG